MTPPHPISQITTKYLGTFTLGLCLCPLQAEGKEPKTASPFPELYKLQGSVRPSVTPVQLSEPSTPTYQTNPSDAPLAQAEGANTDSVRWLHS